MRVFRSVMMVGGAMALLQPSGVTPAFGQAGAGSGKWIPPTAMTAREKNQQAEASVKTRFPEPKLRTIYAEITKADADAKNEGASAAPASHTSKDVGTKTSANQQYLMFEKLDKIKRAAIGAKYKMTEIEVKAVWSLGKQGEWPSGAVASPPKK